ncbi:MAG: hypothetical protein OEZ47_10050, partial [Gammaproteobacteria bacterium]|nr:hypothetical protein [Gammaproteobacteria bacterium]
KGVGEWIFHRKSRYGRQVQTFFPSVVHTQDKLGEVGKLVLEKIQNTKIETDPFPHLVVDKLFPDDYYKELLRKFPSKDQMIPISETARTGSAYSNRLVTLFEKEHFKRLDIAKREFWRELGAWLYHEEFMQGVLDVFWPFIKDRVEEVSKLTGVSRISGDALIVNDQFGYGIGPHTDMLRRLITFLFYLPPDDQFRRHGTSIYVPVEKGFESDGTRHFERGLFKQRALVEFVPNRLLLFVRTNNSFHGVEKIEQAGIDRPLLINNIRLLDVK